MKIEGSPSIIAVDPSKDLRDHDNVTIVTFYKKNKQSFQAFVKVEISSRIEEV
jgi:hypothetical protein